MQVNQQYHFAENENTHQSSQVGCLSQDKFDDTSDLIQSANHYQIRNPYLSMTLCKNDMKDSLVHEPSKEAFVSQSEEDDDFQDPEADLVEVKTSVKIIVEFELKKLIRGFR